MNQNKKITQMPKKEETQPKFPELFTDPEVAEYGEVLSTTFSGQIFVRKDGNIYLFQPVASTHADHEQYYYNKVEFK